MLIFKKNTLFYIIIILSFINIPISAHAADLMFYNMTVSEGLSQTTVQTIFQDSNGYMWIGTTSGLNKYNGFEFEIYNKGLNTNQNLISDNIKCLNEDLNKNLWVGTHDGLSKINLENNKITNYTISNSSIISNKIRDIKITSNGDIIIATGKGLAIYDNFKNDFISLAPKNSDTNFTDINFIEIYNNKVYGISSNCFFKYDIETKEYTVISNEVINYLSQYDSFTDICLYEDKIYLGTLNKGVYMYDINSNAIDINLSLPISDNNSDSSSTVRYIYADEDNLWVGTDHGLYVFKEDSSMYRYKKKFTNKYSLANDNVQFITKDSSGLLWIGTYSGLSTVNYNFSTSYYSCFSSDLDINTNIIFGIHEDSDGTLYMGFAGNGLGILNPKTKVTTYINNKTQNKLSSDNIWDVCGNEEYVFVATDKGVNIINKDTLDVQIISNEYAYNLFLDGDKLWVGVYGGFNIINLKDFTVTSLSDLLNSNNISIGLGSCIFKDSEGIYWLGSATKDGLIRYDSTNNSLKLFEHNELGNSISDTAIISIAEDNLGNLWIGTENGLNKFNRDTEEFISYSVADGLSNNTIYAIIPYENNIWISTNMGINCISFSNDDITSISTHVTSTEFNSNSVCKLKNNKIAFGAIDGIYVVNPKLLNNVISIPEIKFDSFEVNGLTVNDLKNTSISYAKNSVSIKLFTTLYSPTENVKFYYRMNNSTNEWSLINKNKVVFSNLASGKYNIEFKAENVNGASSDIKTLSFEVRPPFWKSTTAKFLYSFIFIVFFIYISLRINYMNNAITIRNRQLSNEMKAKNKLLLKNVQLEKRKNNYLINMSHELRTPLNVIYSVHQLIVELNKKGPVPQKELTKYMNMSSNNIKRLLRLINDLIDSTKIDEGSYKLLIEEKDIVYVVEEAALSLKNLIEKKGIDLIIDTNIEECIMKFDENSIERCIVNIVGNAYKFTDPGGQIMINITDLYSIVRIDISDTGTGLSEENISTIFDRFNQVLNPKRELSGGSGLGLTITKRLVNLHNGHILVKSELGKGSTFTIVLPKNN